MKLNNSFKVKIKKLMSTPAGKTLKKSKNNNKNIYFNIKTNTLSIGRIFYFGSIYGSLQDNKISWGEYDIQDLNNYVYIGQL